MARPRRRTLTTVGLAVAALGAAAYVAAGSVLIAPARADVGPAPAALAATEVRFPSGSGADLAAWAAPGTCRCGAVVVLHGVRANRAEVSDRAVLLHRAGYAVLAVDLQAHGESTGDAITFGSRERLDAVASVSEARRRFPGQPVGLVGVSLGGAAAALAGADLGADAVVLEAVYADIRSATANRLQIRLGALGPALAPVLLAQLPLRTGIRTADLAPVRSIGQMDAPVLVVAGTQDRHTTPADTRALFAAASEPKALWWVEDAAHVDFLAFAPDAYRAHVLGFFARHLHAQAGTEGERADGRTAAARARARRPSPPPSP